MVQHGRGASPRGGRTGAVLAQVIGECEAELRRPAAPPQPQRLAFHGCKREEKVQSGTLTGNDWVHTSIVGGAQT